MNKWIAERTDDVIPAIADAQTFDEATRLVVGTAVCFRVGWKTEFDPAQTTARPFFAASEPAPVDVPTMRQTAPYRLSSQPGFRLLQLPYRGDRLVMVVLLPELGANLPRIESELTADRIAECLRSVHQAEPARVELSLPRFKADRPVSQLTAALQEMGAHQVFDHNGAADLSGLGTNFDGEPIYLSGVSHLAKFVVDEQGAQAAAAPTAAPVAEGPETPVPAPVAFHVDHPFLYFICDPTTGSLLFMGRVVDPRVS
jgi:serpin B